MTKPKSAGRCRMAALINILCFATFQTVTVDAQARAFSGPSQSPAAGETKPPHPVLSRYFVDYFAGAWSGSGRFAKTGKPIKSDVQFQRIAGGEALLVSEAERPPNDFRFTGIISVDSASSEPVLLLASNHEAGARLLRSRGWDGTRITFEADPGLHAWFARERFTFVKKSSDSFSASYEMSFDDGRSWVTGDTQIFTRVVSP